MSLKSFVNSRNGRVGIMVTFLILLSVSISGGMLWWFFYLPSLSVDAVDKDFLERGNQDFLSAALVEEESPLIGLPSSTLEVQDSFREEQPLSIFDYAQTAILNSNQESLVNTHLHRTEAKENEQGLLYDFKFYSSSLSDYDEDGAFETAQRQFRALLEFGTTSLKYVSAPVSSGGRELTIELTAEETFNSDSSLSFQSSWSNLLTELENRFNFNEGTKVNFTLKDASGALTLKTVLNDSESLNAAKSLDERLWNTFNVYLTSSYFDFMDARSITYSIERTSEDSVMTILMGDKAAEPNILHDSMWRAARENKEGALFPGSYITYLMSADNPAPVMTFPSSSRNW